MTFNLGNLEIPDFTPYTRKPHDCKCKELDVRNIVAEILGGDMQAEEEVSGSFRGEKVLLEGNYSILLRYKREKDSKNYPAVVMGFDTNTNGDVIIRHIQGVKQNRISYRFGAGFDSFSYFIELIKQNFTKKGIKVSLPTVPTNLEGTSYGARSPEKYAALQIKLDNLNASIVESSVST